MKYLTLLKDLEELNKHKEVKGLLCLLYTRMDDYNRINKSKLYEIKNFILDNRTLNKYWRILIKSNLIVKTDVPKIWMINPNYARYSVVPSEVLLNAWKELCDHE